MQDGPHRPPADIGFALGHGERLDCGRYELCLEAFVLGVAGRRRGAEAHCPHGCRGWCEIPREVLFAPALRRKD